MALHRLLLNLDGLVKSRFFIFFEKQNPALSMVSKHQLSHFLTFYEVINLQCLL